ncbi:MAG: DNA polymerase II large subunit [Nanoarchaeota archaeon]
MNSEQYFQHINDEVKKAYAVAEVARAKGLDPVSKVETLIAISLAEKAVGLISVVYPQLQDQKIINRILELEKQYGQLTMSVCLGIAEDIAREKYCKFKDLIQAIDAGIRVAFSYFTLGVVSSPIEGYTELKLGKTLDGKDYFIAYFSGPIRSAGTTASCVALMVIDYLRELFNFAKYDPTEDEVKRYVTENYDYHERVNNLQYLPSEEEITFLAKNLPIQISGEPTEQREVYNYKDLPRVETNQIRGGMCLIFSEGLAQKAAKGFRLLKAAKANGFKSTGFDFLQEYVDVIQKKKVKGTGAGDGIPTYMKDIVAGRPIYSHPSRSGGFRFRYGRSRNAGFSATSVSPATMAVSRNFLAVGTQLKIEKPTKGCAISMVENIEGPIVKLKDGSVVKPITMEDAHKIKNFVEEIIYLGDLLFSLDDVINRNHALLKPGYVEEWWNLQLEKAGGAVLDSCNVSFEEAVEMSNKYLIPLYPDYIYYWTQINYSGFLGLVDWIAHGRISEDQLFVLPYSKSDRERFVVGKRALEIIGCPHTVHLESVILNSKDSKALLFNLGISSFESLDNSFDELVKKVPADGDVLEVVNILSSTVIKDKAGDFIGARMGRPEKAKLRKLTGSPHVLFPVSEEGGRLRSVQAAVEYGSVQSDFPNFFCGLCGDDSPYPRCPVCLTLCKKRNYCRACEKYSDGPCSEHPENIQGHSLRRVDMKMQFDLAKKMIGARIDDLPVVIKGVRGTMSQDHSCEHLAKGLLRAKYNLHVNKDGTIRYDMTEMPLMYFKPKEIGTSVKKLIELGYEKDYNGVSLTNDNQILEIFPHDIVLPSCLETLDEKADDVFFNITKFVDDELEKLYKIDRFFNSVNKDSLIGCLFACIAPHICTATVGRLIGFSKTQAFFASPYMHAAMRRDADGDESAVILLMDMLLNFSRKFLPSHRGGTQDAPLVLNVKINAGEVDDQILDLVCGKYPIELYELAEQRKHSSEVQIERIAHRLKNGKDPFTNLGFTHDVDNFNHAVLNSAYKTLPTMHDKVAEQMDLCSKIRAVDVSDVARLVIERHFIRDIRGNLRKFSQQVFRCVDCNEKFRRPPLAGKCTKCGGKIIFTISEGSIIKYMGAALNLARTYKVSPYLLENLEIVQGDIWSIFGKEKEKQAKLVF